MKDIRKNGEIKYSNTETYIDEAPMYLFNQGVNYESYRMLGAHRGKSSGGKDGFLFSVWAPHAKSVSVVCDGNGWDRNKGRMYKHMNSGIWEVFLEGIDEGQCYKFSIETFRGDIFMKADPFAFYSEIRPNTASVTADLSYKWKDEDWIVKRTNTPPYDAPINIYEMHFSSWKTNNDGTYLTYLEMADELIPYVKKMGYTHIEVMPLAEYPFDGSWGYQVTGYYSANSRFGKPAELKYFIDKCHENDIGVIMDWVPAHFPKDSFALANFDGEPLFEHPDSRRGEHKEWGTLIFDWTKTEIWSFLISNALFWLLEYHFDGLRVDAVSSMLYLDYNRNDGEWLPNKYGGKENLEAIKFLQNLNMAVFERLPNVMMIAEESTAWGGVTAPVHEGGLGFNFKWNMGWMHDILDYMQCDPLFRKGNHNKLTFSMMYAFAENYILALSHDEVVHGKRSLIDKMWGSYEEKFSELKLLYSLMYSHPGKKLLFMGGEFGQFVEWRFAQQLDWGLEEYENHRQIAKFSAELGKFYKEHRSFYEIERELSGGEWQGFKWLKSGDASNSVLSYMRISKDKKEKIVIALNFTPTSHSLYTIGVPEDGDYKVVLNTNNKKFGGTGIGTKLYHAKKISCDGFDYSIDINLPGLTALYLERLPATKAGKAARVIGSVTKNIKEKIVSDAAIKMPEKEVVVTDKKAKAEKAAGNNKE